MTTVTALHPEPADEFDVFWNALPKGMKRAGKKVPREKFAKARQHVELQTIMDGIERYRHGKPDYADWCHAATWLHQERWDAEYEDGRGDGRGDSPLAAALGNLMSER